MFLKRSLELDSNAWETYYQLALQQADMHDIRQAVVSVTKAIQMNPTYLPCWHLLTLIVSCPVHGDYKQALKTCEMGLQQAALDNTIDPEDQNGNGHEEAEHHLMFQMTRTSLLYAIHGPEAALESSEQLFLEYGKIAIPEASFSNGSQDRLSYGGAHNGMIISGSLGNLSELQIAAENRRRGRSASNSMVHQHYPVASSSTDLSSQLLGSRSHDNVNMASGHSLTVGRARSASNLAIPSPLGPGGTAQANTSLLSVPDGSTDTSKREGHHHHHIHGLHLFGSRSTSHRNKALENGGYPSAAVNGNTSAHTIASPYGKLLKKERKGYIDSYNRRFKKSCRKLSCITSEHDTFIDEHTIDFAAVCYTHEAQYTYSTTQAAVGPYFI